MDWKVDEMVVSLVVDMGLIESRWSVVMGLMGKHS